MSINRTTTSVSLPDELVKWIESEAKAQDVSKSFIVKLAIKHYKETRG